MTSTNDDLLIFLQILGISVGFMRLYEPSAHLSLN